jgi:hypothetical protein
LAAKAAAIPVRVAREEKGTDRAATTDPCGMTNKTTGNGKDKSEYRDLSTAAAKSAAFGRDDVCFGWMKENRRRKRQRQPQVLRLGCAFAQDDNFCSIKEFCSTNNFYSANQFCSRERILLANEFCSRTNSARERILLANDSCSANQFCSGDEFLFGERKEAQRTARQFDGRRAVCSRAGLLTREL